MDKHKSSRLQPYIPNDNLNNSLGAIRIFGIEMIEDELRPHLKTVLTIIQERKKGAAEQVVVSGILPILAISLRRRGPLTLLTVELVAELAKESVVRKGFGEAGLVNAVLSVMTSSNQELLLHATRAISRMSYDSLTQQEQLLRHGAVPLIISTLLRFPNNEALEGVCLLALCNLGDMGEAEEAGLVWERGMSPRPEESVFHGVAPQSCGFGSSVTLVRVCQWAHGQCSVSIEVFQRCSSSFWNLHGKKRTTRHFSISSLGSCSNLYKMIKYSVNNVPRTQSLRTRMFHTFL
ncbi:uncharacterized protein si:dkey-21e13.3 [Lampris incognitus]|uniref:uncharacterized protein si:dkey-21e13.3 n=1 Tax=Lampris incognitus TaxID=2546036 RepID=UPI0024B54B43|nr:uncharacterized protein si:dkey-21e13.3 [Lampris incognitus]